MPDDENCPDEVVHGTFEDTWAKILKSGGLKKMGRQHVHFAMGVPTSSSSSRNPGTGKPDPKGSIVSKNKSASAEDEDDDDIAIDTFNITAGIPASIKTSNPAKPEETVISGMRASANILIWVDVKRSAVEGGLEWWRSANGVVLTEGDGEGKVGLEWVRRVERRGTGEVVWRGGEGGGRGKG